MKKIILVTIILFSHPCYAQTWNEWFNQKKTRIQYLLDQIAANKVYIEYAEKGYKIARDGLAAIGDIQKGEFNLHLDFFNSLKEINPKIKNYTRVADIIQRQLQIKKIYTNSYKSMKASGQFTANEIGYFYSVFSKLLDETTTNMDQLLALITANAYTMKDDERMKRIDDLYTDMESKYGFAKSFSNEAQLLSMQRVHERSEAEISQSLYNIK
jgi:hypothetical protein